MLELLTLADDADGGHEVVFLVLCFADDLSALVTSLVTENRHLPLPPFLLFVSFGLFAENLTHGFS